MSYNWPKVKLGKYCLKIGSGATPRGGSSVYLESGEITLIRSQNIYNDGFKAEGLVYITSEAAQKLKNVIIQPNDILINITGDSVARVCIAPKNYLPARVNQHVAILRVKSNEFDHRYLRYFLTSKKMQNYLFTIASTGGTRNALTKSMLESLEVSKPSLSVQKRIGDVLEQFENKMLINTQTNQTLEEMAQAIFKSWFVDFDPVKAKINGKKPEGMDAATASLFPEKLVESELGLIPEGWEIKPFSEWVKIIKGKNITKKTIIEGDVPVVAGGLKPAYFHNTHNVVGPVITISASGANAGYVNLYFESIWASDCSYISKSTTPMFFLQYVALKYKQKKIFDMQTGAAQPHIYPSDFDRLMVVVPNEKLCRKLEYVFLSFFGTVANNKQQNIELAALRDTLLPKLLSGEIELGASEDLAEAI